MRRATLSLSEAAQALGLSVQTLKAACRSGALPSAVVSGRKRLVTEGGLAAWLGSEDAARAAFDVASAPGGGRSGAASEVGEGE